MADPPSPIDEPSPATGAGRDSRGSPSAPTLGSSITGESEGGGGVLRIAARRPLRPVGGPEDETVHADESSSLARGSTFDEGPDGGAARAVRFRSRTGVVDSVGAPARLGRLEILGRLGAGGMGEVFVAQDGALGRRVAVKLVRSDIDTSSSDATARIIREAQLMARLAHPNVVRIYDVGQIGERVYITMELVEGTTLRAWLGEAPRAWREIIDVFILAGRGLAAAHAMGLVHRDFKPSNVLVGDDGRVMVADFGLARALTSAEAASTLDATEPRASAGPSDVGSGSGSTQPLTSHGAVLGTPGYMSPEQLMGATADARSDVFSYCVALYEALYGVRPFAGETRTATLANIEAGALAAPRRSPSMPARIGKAIRRGLAAAPGERFASMELLLAELERARSRRLRSLIGAGLIAASGLLIGVAVRGDAGVDPCEAAAHELDDAWGPARARELRAAFTASRAPFAADAWAGAEVELNTYMTDWTGARIDACQAREVRGAESGRLFDLRMICLGRRERALRALLDQFSIVDPATVEGAAEAVASLPDIGACADAEALTRGVMPADDPLVAAAALRARETLARAEVQHATGHDRAALAILERELPRIEAIDDPSVVAEAKLLHGQILAELGVLDQAEVEVRAAIDLAEASRHDEVAFAGWLFLTRFLRQHLAAPARAEEALRRARAVAVRLGDRPRNQAEVLLEEGMIFYRQRRFEASERLLRRALAIADEAPGALVLRERLLIDLADTLEKQGQMEEARSAFEEAIELASVIWGPLHPRVMNLDHDFGDLLTKMGETEEAQSLLEGALATAESTLGADHPACATIHGALAVLALTEGDPAEAEAHAEAAMRVDIAAYPSGHPVLVNDLMILGTARYFLRNFNGAIDAYTEARAIHRRIEPEEPIAAVEIVVNLAETYLAIDRFEEAEARFAEADGLLERAASEEPGLESRILAGRGRILLAAGSPAAAIERLEAALRLREALPEDPMIQAELRDALDRAHARLAP